jgi:glycine cleavage system aminomethyltransferase T
LQTQENTESGIPIADPRIAFGSRVRTSPFFAATRRHGCKAYSIYNHMFMPLYYESPEADYWRLVTDVTLWDVSAQRQVAVTGPDAARFIQYLTPRNLSRYAVGQCKYVLLTDDDGGIVNDLLLLKLSEQHFWLSIADSDVLLWARGVALSSGLDVVIEEPDVSPLQVQGPRSTDTMQAVFGDWVTELGLFRFVETELDGMPLVVSRTGWSGERGYEIFLRDGSFGDALWERIMDAGRPFNLGLCGPSSIRRMEGCLLSYGADITLDTNPYEANLDWLVDLDQPADFIGKKSLTRIHAEGVKRRLVSVTLDGDPLAAPNEAPWPAYAGDRAVGHVTSCVYSPRLQKNIGLAMIAIDHTAIGSRFRATSPLRDFEATVVPMPFVPHRLK